MKTYKTGQIAEICGFKNARMVARRIDRGEIKGKIIQGKNGRARKSYHIVNRASLMKYVEEHCLDVESALSWFLSQKIEDFGRRLTQAEREHGFFGEHPGLVEGVRAVVSVLSPDTSEKFDPLSKIVFGELSELMKHDLRLRFLRANPKK